MDFHDNPLLSSGRGARDGEHFCRKRSSGLLRIWWGTRTPKGHSWTHVPGLTAPVVLEIPLIVPRLAQVIIRQVAEEVRLSLLVVVILIVVRLSRARIQISAASMRHGHDPEDIINLINAGNIVLQGCLV